MSQKTPMMPFLESAEEPDDELDPTWGSLSVHIQDGVPDGLELDSKVDTDFTVFNRVYLDHKQHVEQSFGTYLDAIDAPAVNLHDVAGCFLKAMHDANLGFFTSQELYDSLGPISPDFLAYSQALMGITLEELMNKLFNIPIEPKLMIYFKYGDQQINVEYVMPERDEITQSLMMDERRPTVCGTYVPQ